MAVFSVRAGRVLLRVLYLLACSVGISNSEQGIRLEELEARMERAKAALNSGDPGTAERLYAEALTSAPDHPELLYGLARAQAGAGHRQGALQSLEHVLALGFGDSIQDDDAFKALSGIPEFDALVRRYAPQSKAITHSAEAFTIEERDLIPEGMASDPRDGTLYVSSLYKRKIVAINRSGQVRDFVTEAQDGIWQILGMKVDAVHGVLYVCSAVDDPGMKGFRKEDVGRSGVFAFELVTGHLRARFLAAQDGRQHLFNDLVLTKGGNLYVTDSKEGSLYRIETGRGTLMRMTEPDRFMYPNGIALSVDERFLYVAHVAGIDLVERETGRGVPLPHPRNTTLAGVDGLYFHHGSLLAIQNGLEPNRIMQFRLNGRLNRVEAAEVLERRNPLITGPTTGTLVGQQFYFIGNSQTNAFYPDGRIRPLEKLAPVLILRMHVPY